MSHFNNFVTVLNILTSPLWRLIMFEPPAATLQPLLMPHSDRCTCCTALYWRPTRPQHAAVATHRKLFVSGGQTDRQTDSYVCLTVSFRLQAEYLRSVFSPVSLVFLILHIWHILFLFLFFTLRSIPSPFTFFFHCFSVFFFAQRLAQSVQWLCYVLNNRGVAVRFPTEAETLSLSLSLYFVHWCLQEKRTERETKGKNARTSIK